MPPCPIDDAGRFTKEVPDFEGMHVKVSSWRSVVIVMYDMLINLLDLCRPPTSRS